VEGEKLVELAEVSNEEEDEMYFLDQEYSGLKMIKFGNVLCVISTYF
jgi:hypothetical protein